MVKTGNKASGSRRASCSPAKAHNSKKKKASAVGKNRIKHVDIADAMLRQSDDRYRTIFESSPEAIILLDAEGRITDINQRGADMIGCKREDVLGKQYMGLDHLPHETRLKAMESFAMRAQGHDVTPYETEFIGSDGKHRIGLVNLAPIRNKNGQFLGALVMVSDVTQIRQLQQQLLHAQKMESVGQLAGGIAHDFNNVLLSIMGHGELLLATMDEKDIRRQDILEIRNSVNSAAAVTRQLLAFSRKQTLERKVIDVNAVLKNMETMLRRLLGEDVRLTVTPDQNLPRVYADAGQIEQVLMNLAVNARDAMPHGGRLIISTCSVTLNRQDVACIPETREGDFVCLEMTDTGTGMTPEVMAHAFEPFFTTKVRGKGTGLGLATVYGIVKQHGGWVTVQSTEGKGTMFRIYLPVSTMEAPVTALAKNESVETAKCIKPCLILLVEDEASVREPMTRVLIANGHNVISAASAGEAMSINMRAEKGFDMLLSDVVLTDGTGVEVAEHVLSRHPATRILLFSGYTDERARWEIIKQRGYYFMQKPFSTEDLLRMLYKMVNDGK
jgi:two-component system, cell cycle sensor histidine kinase and response regulator CckA